MSGLAVGVLMASALTGCLDGATSTGPEPVAAWEATLESTVRDMSGAPMITGRAAVILQETRTEVGIGLDEFTDDVSLTWGLFEGTCVESGTRVGLAEQYPRLSPDNLESAVALSQRIAQSLQYHVSVSDAATDQRLACGNLLEVEL